MPLFVISYDLNHEKDYQKLWDELKRLKCCHTLESVWLGKITGTAQGVLKNLSKFVDPDDSLIVAEINKSSTALKMPFAGAFEYLA